MFAYVGYVFLTLAIFAYVGYVFLTLAMFSLRWLRLSYLGSKFIRYFEIYFALFLGSKVYGKQNSRSFGRLANIL